MNGEILYAASVTPISYDEPLGGVDAWRGCGNWVIELCVGSNVLCQIRVPPPPSPREEVEKRGGGLGRGMKLYI